MLVKMGADAGRGVLNTDLSTRLEELAQKAKVKAAELKSATGQNAGGAAATAPAEPEQPDFFDPQTRSSFLSSLQGAGASGVQTDEMLTQHSLDPERVAQLLDL